MVIRIKVKKKWKDICIEEYLLNMIAQKHMRMDLNQWIRLFRKEYKQIENTKKGLKDDK